MDARRFRSGALAWVSVAMSLLLAGKVMAQETIYVGQNDPSAMHAYAFDGTAFTEQALDPSNPANYLRGGGGDPFNTAVSDHFFLMGNPQPGLPLSVVEPFSRTELPRLQGTVGASASIIVTANPGFALTAGSALDGIPSLAVDDISPASDSFLNERAAIPLLPVGASGDPVLQTATFASVGAACLSPDRTILYLPLSGGDLGNDGAIIAVDLSGLPSLSIMGAVRLPGNPASGLRCGTIGGAPYLFVASYNLLMLPVSGATFGTPIGFNAGYDSDTGQYWIVQDVYIEDGPSPKAIGLIVSYKDFTYTSAEEELVTIELSGSLTDGGGGTCVTGGARPCASSTTPIDLNADGSGLRAEPSLDGQYLYVLESAYDTLFCPSRLHAFSIAGLNAGSASAHITTRFIDSDTACPPDEPRSSADYIGWLQRPEIVAWAVGLTVRNAVTPAGSGIKIVDANTEVGKIFANDTGHALTVSGSSLDRVVAAYLGRTALTIVARSSTSLTLSIPQFIPSGDPSLALTDSTGGVTVFPTTFTVNDSLQYLPKTVVYGLGFSSAQYSQISAASGSEVVSNFPSYTQGTLFGQVTKDGRYLLTSGFRDGRVAVHSLIANSAAPGPDHAYGWNTFVEALYSAGDSGIVGNMVQNPAAGRDTIYISTDYDAVYLIDPATYPPTFIDADGDASTTDPGMEFYPGVSGIPLPTDGYRSLAIRADGAHEYLYSATGARIVRIDVTTDHVTAANVTSYSTGLPGGSSRTLAFSVDGTELFFNSSAEATIRVYPRSTSDGSINTSSYTTLTSPAGWSAGERLFLLASADGRYLYAAAPAESRLDIFDLRDLSNITYATSVSLPDGVSGLVASVAGDYLFVPVTSDDSVVSIYEGAPAPGLTPHQIISSAGAASGIAGVAISPGAGTDAGTNVAVTPTQDSTITFSDVTSAGNTTVTSSNSSAITVPPNFEIAANGQAPVFYDVSTTASFDGSVTVCFSYPVSTLSSDALQSLTLLHQQGAAFVAIPTTPDAVKNLVCGQVTSFSQFVIA